LKNEYEPKEYTLEELEEDWKKSHNFLDDLFPSGIAGYRPLYTLTHPWIIPSYIFREIKWAWQRTFRGWDDKLVWSIDFYLATNIPQWLRELKKDKHGIPSMLLEDSDWDESKFNYMPGAFEKKVAVYDDILDQIILGFESYIKIEELRWDDPERKVLEEKYNIGFDLFRKYFSTLWD
jgi:hypothetical protein